MNQPTRRTILSRNDFQAALRSAFAEAAAAGAREILLCDASYADWPLSERGLIDDLTRWADSRRQLVVYARSFDEVARRHGRWTEWRRQWSHIVQCRANAELESTDFPTICLATGVTSVRLADPIHFRGLASNEAADAVACREAIDAVSQRSVEAYPATTLGL